MIPYKDKEKNSAIPQAQDACIKIAACGVEFLLNHQLLSKPNGQELLEQHISSFIKAGKLIGFIYQSQINFVKDSFAELQTKHDNYKKSSRLSHLQMKSNKILRIQPSNN